MSNTAPIKVIDQNSGTLIGKIRQVRRHGVRLFEPLGKDAESGRYLPLDTAQTRSEAEDAIRLQWLFG